MSHESSRRREEDEMLKYAHVERSVQKHYAIRYSGYPDELPYFFTRKLIGKNTLRGRHLEIEFECSEDLVSPANVKKCSKGDWVLVDQDGNTDILSDETFRARFMPVLDLVY